MLLCVLLSGCWPFFYEPLPGDDDGGVFDDDGGMTTTDAGPALDKVNCTWKGKKLYGKIEFVDSFPDLKIREVTALADLKVEMVSSLPSRCGEWQEVTSLPTLRVKKVTAFEDLEVEFVTAFPGFR
ncbi:MAG: hypothetical protein QM817_25215 [Archangium sp.]